MQSNTVDIRVGTAEYRPDTHVIWLHIPSNRQVYEVDLDRCKTAEQALDWVLHVADKQWCTGEMLRDLVRCIQKVCMLRYGKSAYDYFRVGGKLCSTLRNSNLN